MVPPTRFRAFVVSSADFRRCPLHSFNPVHYREDGSCLCSGVARCSSGQGLPVGTTSAPTVE